MTRYLDNSYHGGYILSEDEPEPSIEPCELCDEPASEKVDLAPVKYPGQFIAKLCKKCAEFERKRIQEETQN